MYRIYIVEDEPKIADMLARHLERYGHQVHIAQDLRQVKSEFLEIRPHLVILDINLPYYDGFYWCRQIRTVSSVPVIYISARSDDMDQVRAIENGGDDYLVKPFSLEVALAKVHSQLRRAYGEYSSPSTAEVQAAGGLLLDASRLVAEHAGRSVQLTRNEFLLLRLLLQQAGKVVSRSALLEALWEDSQYVDDNTLTVNVARLRQKLEGIGLQQAIETVRGYGYRLQAGREDYEVR